MSCTVWAKGLDLGVLVLVILCSFIIAHSTPPPLFPIREVLTKKSLVNRGREMKKGLLANANHSRWKQIV